MKTISSELQAHLDSQVTTVATCWDITRVDGVEFHFTDHDEDIIYGGDTYISAIGYNRSNIAGDSSMSVDNLDLQGIIDDDLLNSEDLRNGKFDFAEIKIFLLNYNDLSQGIVKLRRGWIGEVTLTDTGIFKAELRGMTQAMSQRIGEAFSPECRADLGDARCGIPIDPPILQRSTAVVLGEYYRIPPYFPDNYDIRTQGVIADDIESLSLAIQGLESRYVVGENEHSTVEVVEIGATYLIVQAKTPGAAGNSIATTSTAANASWLASTLQGGTDDPPVKASGTLNFSGLLSIFDTITIDSIVYRIIELFEYPQDYQQNRMFEVTTAGTTAATQPSFNFTVDADTTDGGAVLTAREAWTRHAVISGITDNTTFAITVTEPRDIDDWFNYGTVVFENGPNAGYSMEIKDWNVSAQEVTLYLAAPYTPVVGNKIKLHAGCSKRFATDCCTKFDNAFNFRGEPFVPGQDEYFTYPDAH